MLLHCTQCARLATAAYLSVVSAPSRSGISPRRRAAACPGHPAGCDLPPRAVTAVPRPAARDT